VGDGVGLAVGAGRDDHGGVEGRRTGLGWGAAAWTSIAGGLPGFTGGVPLPGGGSAPVVVPVIGMPPSATPA
jgi:hypothetical protein